MKRSITGKDDKICIITGATSGIGFATAMELAKQKMKIVIIGRNEEKMKRKISKIVEKTGNLNVEYILADLSILSEVRKAVDIFLERHQKLDILINNAGVSLRKYQETKEGFEKSFVVNYLSHFLLTNLLIETMKDSFPSRIINVSSELHRRAQINFEDIQMKKEYNGMKAYSNTKLMNVFFTYKLSSNLEETGVTVNAMHPGLVRTNLGGNSGIISKIIWHFITLFAHSSEESAKTIRYLATSPDIEGITGKYFSKEKEINTSPISYDRNIADKLWNISVYLSGL